jgi:hypothetical protein
MPQFEYMVCSVQLMHVTFMNGDWQGSLAPNAPHALESCPTLWEFLEEAGESGWELVSVDSSGNHDLTTLYLKRQKV